jgi:pimeloyl-ACP methyl ester carboxylesterase
VGHFRRRPLPLACAALLPDLVAAAASLASHAPYEAERLDWSAGMDDDEVAYNRLLLSDPQAARARVDKDRDEALATSASDLSQALESFVSPADAAVLDGQMAEYLTYYEHEGLAPGSQGLWDDACAHVRPWGFELPDITVPVLVVHGRQDKFVPFAHGQWLAAHIPGPKPS